MIESKELQGVFVLSLVIIMFYFLIKEVLHYQEGSWLILGLTMMIFAWLIIVNSVDILPWKRNTMVFTASGHPGTQQGSAVQREAGYETRHVTFERKNVDKELRKEYDGALWWVRDILSGSITIPITDKHSMFMQIPESDCENRDGCVIYLGRLDGGTLRHPNLIAGQKQIEHLTKILSYVNTKMQQAEEQLAVLGNQQVYDMEKQSQKFKAIAENVKHVQLITGKGASGVESAASELS